VLEHVGNPEMYIHTISGTPTPNTMRIVGTIQQQIVVILVDSRSTHNFFRPFYC
jgi:2-polyprenyl-3-methyl-5-hydroxy-6-metoxy-1,4-benzoquinol methylase